MIDEAIGQLTPIVGMTKALATVGADRATWYRHHRKSPAPPRTQRVAAPQPRALSEVERKEIKSTLESDEFVDEAPATVYAKLLDQGTYLASVSTMYRVLHQDDEVRERRRQATHPAHKKPELIATEPNSEMDERYRDVLLLMAGPGLTYQEMSQALGIPVGTVRSRISRGRGQLRELLGLSGQYEGRDEALGHVSLLEGLME